MPAFLISIPFANGIDIRAGVRGGNIDYLQCSHIGAVRELKALFGMEWSKPKVEKNQYL